MAPTLIGLQTLELSEHFVSIGKAAAITRNSGSLPRPLDGISGPGEVSCCGQG